MIPSKILVPTDFSETAEHGVQYALELAKALGAKVSLLYVYAIDTPESGGQAEEILRESEQDARNKLEKAAAKYREHAALLSTLLANGDPSDAIVNTAGKIGADLIVIGTHGRTGVRRMLLGSVAETVLRAAPCPVLAIRLPLAPR